MKIDVNGLKKFVGDHFTEGMVETPEGVLNYLIGDARSRLYSFVATSNLTKDKFYMSHSEVMNEIKKNIAAVILEDGNYEMNVTWLCKLAVFARHNLYMRTIGLVIIKELLTWVSDCQQIEDAIFHVVNRPDEIVKLVTMYVDGDKDKPLDNILKRGLARTYSKFDEYQFSKYKNTVCPVTGFTISKLMKIVHPNPTSDITLSESFDKRNLYSKVRKNNLDEPYTWEVELSKAGIESDRSDFVEEWFIQNVFDYYEIPGDMWKFSVCQAKKFLRECRLGNVKSFKTYDGNILTDFRKALKEYTNNLGVKKVKMEELIDSGRLPYQAALMNLRSFMEMGVSDTHIKKICDYLVRNIDKSKLQPFNFLSAWKAINSFTNDTYGQYRHNRYARMEELKANTTPLVEYINSTLEKCIVRSYSNVNLFRDFGDNNLFACDVSGSMMGNSFTNNITAFDVGLIMAMVAQSNIPKSDLGIFGDEFKMKNEVVKSDLGLFNKFLKFIENEGEVGYSTNGWKVMKHAVDSKKKYNMVMMFTDCQMYDFNGRGQRENTKIGSYWKQYKEMYPDARLVLFNLNSTGNTAIEVGKDDVYMVSGWNNEIFNCLHNLMNTGNALASVSSVKL